MNVFNRIFTIVSLVILIIVGALVLLLPDVLIGLVTALSGALQSMGAGQTAAVFAVRLLLTLVWVGILGFVLRLELKRGGPTSIRVLRSNGTGKLRVQMNTVHDRVREQITSVPGVLNSTVQISTKQDQLAVKAEVLTVHGTDLVQKGEEVVAAVRNVVREQLGLKLSSKPDITMRASQQRMTMPSISSLIGRRKSEDTSQLPAPSNPAHETVDAIDVVEVVPTEVTPAQETPVATGASEAK